MIAKCNFSSTGEGTASSHAAGNAIFGSKISYNHFIIIIAPSMCLVPCRGQNIEHVPTLKGSQASIQQKETTRGDPGGEGGEETGKNTKEE